MRPVTRGIYRTRSDSGEWLVGVEYSFGIGPKPPSVHTMELTEQRYRQRKYEPVFDSLPLKDGDTAEAA